MGGCVDMLILPGVNGSQTSYTNCKPTTIPEGKARISRIQDQPGLWQPDPVNSCVRLSFSPLPQGILLNTFVFSWKYFYFLGEGYPEVNRGSCHWYAGIGVSKNLDEAAGMVRSGCQGTRVWFCGAGRRQGYREDCSILQESTGWSTKAVC